MFLQIFVLYLLETLAARMLWLGAMFFIPELPNISFWGFLLIEVIYSIVGKFVDVLAAFLGIGEQLEAFNEETQD